MIAAGQVIDVPLFYVRAKVCASATLASFLYIVERKEGANAAMATYGEPKMQEIVCMPILNQTHNSGGEDDRIELV